VTTVTMEHFDSWLCLDASPVCLAFADGRCGRVTSQKEVVYAQSSVSICRIYTSLCLGLSLKCFVDTRYENAQLWLFSGLLRNNQASRLFLHWKIWENYKLF